MRRLLSGYHLASPAFALLDAAAGFNVRTAFLGDSPLRFLYYAASFGCGLVGWRRPALAPVLGMVESGANVAMVVVGLYARVWALGEAVAEGAGASGAVPMSHVANAALSGLVFAVSFYGNQAMLLAKRGDGR